MGSSLLTVCADINMSFTRVLLIFAVVLSVISDSGLSKVKQCDNSLNTTDLEDGEKTILVDTEIEVVFDKQFQQKERNPMTNSYNKGHATCPLWFVYNNGSNSGNSNTRCQCGDELHGIIHCNKAQRKACRLSRGVPAQQHFHSVHRT